MEGNILNQEIAIEQNPVNEQITSIKSKRKYDIIIFGASGFTGKHVVMEMGHLSQTYNLTWAIAGRNIKKLQNILNKLYKTLDGYEDKKIDIIYANVYDMKTVMRMAQSTSVVINCTSPYYIYGEVVVKSCVLTSTHYVDVTGEPLFMEKMAYMYNKQAEENNSIIVSALGIESVPADFGVEFLYKHFNGELKNVDMYMKMYLSSFAFSMTGFIHTSMWISVILHLATKKLRLYYRNLLNELLGMTKLKQNVFKILHRQQISMQNNTIDWCLAFPEPDEAVVARSIHHAKTIENLPYNFHVRNYRVMSGLLPAIFAILLFVLLSILVIFEPIRIFLIRFSELFSFGIISNTGPDEKYLEKTCMSLSLIGYGTTSVKPFTTNHEEITQKDITATRKIIVKVNAKHPEYGFSSKAVILGAITILKDQNNIPKGGVLTPAAAFRNTQFVNRLMDNDVAAFEIESDMVTYNYQN